MSPVLDATEMPTPEALNAVSDDADANAGEGNVDDAVSPCPSKALGSIWIRLDLTPTEAVNEAGSLRFRAAESIRPSRLPTTMLLTMIPSMCFLTACQQRPAIRLLTSVTMARHQRSF